MSRIIDELNKIKIHKTGKHALAKEEKPVKEEKPIPKPVSQEPQHSTIDASLAINLIFFVLIILNIALTIKLFIATRKYSFENSNVMQKIDNVEQLLTSGYKQIEADLDNLKFKTIDYNSRIRQVENDNEDQSTSIGNLKKSKDAALNRINKLESDLEGLKAQYGEK